MKNERQRKNRHENRNESRSEYRNENGGENRHEDLCWGRGPVFALLELTPDRCMKVLLSKTVQGQTKARMTELCKAAHVPLQYVDGSAIDRLTPGENTQGMLAYIAPVRLWSAEELLADLPEPPAPSLVLLCDHIQDPHNLGAIIRSAEAAGAAAVLFPKRGGSLPTGTVVKTSAGAALRLPMAMVGNVLQTIRLLQEARYWVVGLTVEAQETLFKADMPARTALVVGAEGEGLSTLAAKSCDELRNIPMRGATGSLNASVAAALALFEWSRSR